MRVEAVCSEDARRDGGPRARLADRDDRLVAREVGLAEREQAVRDVAAAGDVAGVALVLLAHVDELGPALEERVELLDRDELERLRAAAEDVAGDVEVADRAEAARRERDFVLVRGRDDDGACVEHERRLRREARARDGHAERTAMVPGRERLDRAHVEDLVPSGGAASSVGSGCAPTNGPRFSSTIRSMFGGRGAEMPVDSAMKSATSSCASAGLKRRSKPIVVDAFELIAFPHSEPATWPG